MWHNFIATSHSNTHCWQLSDIERIYFKVNIIPELRLIYRMKHNFLIFFLISWWMSMKSAVKFDFILATFKISQNCLLLFLELLALYEGYLTHVQGRVTHLFIFRSPIEDILISQVMWDHGPISEVSSNF